MSKHPPATDATPEPQMPPEFRRELMALMDFGDEETQ